MVFCALITLSDMVGNNSCDCFACLETQNVHVTAVCNAILYDQFFPNF